MHMVSKKDFDSAELETMRTSKISTTVMTAKGEVQTREEATVYVKQSDLFVRVMAIHTTGSAVKNHISPKMARDLIAKKSGYVPFVVLGLSANSSSTTLSPTSSSSSSSSQDSVFDVNRYTENPVPQRSGSTSG